MKMFEARVMAAIVLAVGGMWTMGNFARVEDLSAYRGGADCSERYESVSCDTYNTTTCIKCDSGGTDLRCRSYTSEWNCLACNDGTISDCGGRTLTATVAHPLPPATGPNECVNWQDSGVCSRTYMQATSGSCAPGKSC